MRVQTVIIGAGPAGLSAAIQMQRSKAEFILIEKDEAGGLLREANLVENYPGFPGGIKGSKLVSLMLEQINYEKIPLVKAEVTNVSRIEHNLYKVSYKVSANETDITCEYLIIATGTKPKPLKPEQQAERLYYSVLPLQDLRNKKIAIIGAGDCAFDYALTLGIANTVTIFGRSDKPKCLPLLFERISAIRNIRYIKNADIKYDFKGYDYVLSAIGRTPALSFIGDELLSDRCVPNIFYAGDVRNGLYRQCSIAVGQGLEAAMKILELTKKEPV